MPRHVGEGIEQVRAAFEQKCDDAVGHPDGRCSFVSIGLHDVDDMCILEGKSWKRSFIRSARRCQRSWLFGKVVFCWARLVRPNSFLESF